MTFDWKAVIAAIVAAIEPYIGKFLTDWLAKLFGNATPPSVQTSAFVGAAPEEIREKFGKQILDWVTSAVGGHRIFGGIVINFVRRNIGRIIDLAYDKYFGTPNPSLTVSAGEPWEPLPEAVEAACRDEVAAS